MKEQNAVIESARIEVERGLLTAWVVLDYGNSGQGFGGYVLYLPKEYENSDDTTNYAGHFIWRVMQIAGVQEWSHIVGKTIRVRSEHSGVHSIGHIVKDDWFCPKEEFDKMRGEEANQ